MSLEKVLDAKTKLEKLCSEKIKELGYDTSFGYFSKELGTYCLTVTIHSKQKDQFLPKENTWEKIRFKILPEQVDGYKIRVYYLHY